MENVNSLECIYCKDKDGNNMKFATPQNKKKHLETKKHKKQVSLQMSENTEFNLYDQIISNQKNEISNQKNEISNQKNEIERLTLEIESYKERIKFLEDNGITLPDENTNNKSTNNGYSDEEIDIELDIIEEPNIQKPVPFYNKKNKHQQILDCSNNYLYDTNSNNVFSCSFPHKYIGKRIHDSEYFKCNDPIKCSIKSHWFIEYN